MLAMFIKAYCVDFIVNTKPIYLNNTFFSVSLYYGGPQVSRQKRKALGKRKKLVAKEKCFQQIRNAHGKEKKRKKEKLTAQGKYSRQKINAQGKKKNACGKK